MANSIPPSRGSSSYNTTAPASEGKTHKFTHIKKANDSASKLNVPTDYSSTTFIQKLATKNEAKGKHLASNTKGVGAFLSGNAGLYANFMTSVSKAQRML